MREGGPITSILRSPDVDWTLPNGDLARQYRLSYGQVLRLPAKLRMPVSTKRRNSSKLRGPDVDWSLSNKELARQYGLSKQEISRMRGLLGATPSPIKRGR